MIELGLANSCNNFWNLVVTKLIDIVERKAGLSSREYRCWTELGKQILCVLYFSFIIFITYCFYPLIIGCRSITPHTKYFIGVIFKKIHNHYNSNQLYNSY
jgi:hypothetical protein